MKNCMILLWVALSCLPNYQRIFANNREDLSRIELTDTVTNDRKVKKKNAKNTEKDTVAYKGGLRKLTPYEKIFDGKAVESVKSPFITLHKIDGKIYFEFPVKYLEREMLLSAAPSQTSNSTFADMAHKTIMHVKYSLVDSLVLLKTVNTTTTYDQKEKNIASAIKDNTQDNIVDAYKMLAYSPDKTSVVFEPTKFFCETNSHFPLFRSYYSYFRISGRSKPYSSMFNTAIINSIKSFEDNLTIKITIPHDVKLLLMGLPYAITEVTVTATYSLLLLPEDHMRPRKSDSRVGIFLTDKEHYTMDKDGVDGYSLASRWRIEPKDEKAYKQGKLVEPKKPIVWYIDSAFPEEWKEPIKKAVLRWNAAFEKIGFKNVMQVRDFPKNDPAFDPENLKYSCIRFLPTGITNAMGPSYVDPTSGEIINASVLVYSNVVELINNWRFVQTAQVDPSVRNKKMPKKIMDESIEYVVAHEVGHTLGFMHNMAASAAYPVDSLRSASFTQKYGTTPSIMDYARFNYVAQPGDKGVKLTPPTLGVYDEFLVKWNYQYFPDAKNMEEETATLEKMVDAKAGDPKYRYGRQQIASRYDPSALEEDLGDDPMKAGDYGIKNLKYILSNMENWIKDDPDGSHKASLYQGIANQYFRYLRNVSYNIGGIYLKEVKEGTPGERFSSVPKATQKESLKWIINHLRDSEWLNNKELTRKFPLGVNTGAMIERALASTLPYLYKGVLLSSHVSQNPYTLTEFLDDYYKLVFADRINASLTRADKALQTAAVEWIANTFTEQSAGNGLFGIISEQDAYQPSLEDIIAYGLDETGIINQFTHELRLMQEKENIPIKTENTDLENFGSGYGWQRNISITAIDDSKTAIYAFGSRIKQLLKDKIAGTNGDTRAHYELLLFTLNQKLKNL